MSADTHAAVLDSQVEPHVVADGVEHKPERIEGDAFTFRLTLPLQELRLVSGSARPAEVLGTNDWRRLGVAVRKLTWRQGEATFEMPVSYPGFLDGFHHFEQDAFRWTNGSAALPLPEWQGEASLRLVLEEWAGSRAVAQTTHEAVVLGAFESLGENCELGFAQRHFDVNPPLSAFRWSGTTYARLMEGLANRFEGLGDPARTEVIATEFDHQLQTPYLRMHTWHLIGQPADHLSLIHAWGATTLRLLRRKLLHDLATGLRIFVFTTKDPDIGEAEMRRLHAAVRSFGPTRLLCVRQSGDALRDGEVERIGDGLYSGYLERFVLKEGPYDAWYGLCSRTLALDQGDEVTRP